jgi:hypothetical protein
VATDGPNGCLTQAANIRKNRFQHLNTHIQKKLEQLKPHGLWNNNLKNVCK